MNFKPLLSATLEHSLIQHLNYPLIGSPKLDGIRCIIHGGQAVSRNLKPFRNQHVQDCLHNLPEGLDGELIVGEPNVGNVLNRTFSGVMSADGKPDFTFWVFDKYNGTGTFESRLDRLSFHTNSFEHAKVVTHNHIRSPAELTSFEELALKDGYEGIMLRDPRGRYKFGRSTLSEAILMKLKRFTDGECTVVAIREGMTNLNEQTMNALGYMERSKHVSNMAPSGQVGTIIGRDCATGETYDVSPGRMTQDMRIYYLNHPGELIGKIIKHKSFDYGAVNTARFRTFQAFRDEGDMAT